MFFPTVRNFVIWNYCAFLLFVGYFYGKKIQWGKFYLSVLCKTQQTWRTLCFWSMLLDKQWPPCENCTPVCKEFAVAFLWPLPVWVMRVLCWMGTWTQSYGPHPSCTTPRRSRTTKISLIRSPMIPMCSSFQALQPNLPQGPPNCPCPRDPQPCLPLLSAWTPRHVSLTQIQGWI